MIYEVETVKQTAESGYVRLCGCRPKSVTVGLGCGLGRIPAMSVITALLRQHMWQIWRYVNELCRYLYLLHCCFTLSAGSQFFSKIRKDGQVWEFHAGQGKVREKAESRGTVA